MIRWLLRAIDRYLCWRDLHHLPDGFRRWRAIVTSEVRQPLWIVPCLACGCHFIAEALPAFDAAIAVDEMTRPLGGYSRLSQRRSSS